MDASNYVIAYNGNSHMYFIRPTTGGAVPDSLDGFFTHKSYAEKQIVAYVEEQISGAQKGQQAVQSVRKGTNNRG